MADEEDGDVQEPEYVEHIRKKSADFAGWYNDVVRKAELADYTPVRGCMVIRPYGFALWEHIRDALDGMIKATGHENMYFPLFIPESYLLKEAEHVEGFAPQVAWVTRGGQDELEEPLAVRPTSEAIIGPLYKRWIQSYRDLPVLINQWANVVRWELRTRLFLRTAEFLWQEGHTFHETAEEATAETEKMLECYRSLAEDHLALPVLTGRKTASETFAGAEYTLAIEAIMSDGKALQSGTSHNLGENFTRAYDVTFATRDNKRGYPHGTSWGLSTRVIGGLIMAHGDDAGLILPPRVAPIQAVIVPIYRGEERERVITTAQTLSMALTAAGIRHRVDDRDEKPGFKFNDWELRGVPFRIEIGPRDVESGSAVLADRLSREKSPAPLSGLPARLAQELEGFQRRLFERALEIRRSFTVEAGNRKSLLAAFADGRNSVALAPWCGDAGCEAEVKEQIRGATIRLIAPEPPVSGARCAGCGQASSQLVYWARGY